MSTVVGAQQPSGSDSTELRPLRVEISDAAIDDLRGQLPRTRRPEKEPVADWSMGIPLAHIQELAEYWEKSYDMQRVADRSCPSPKKSNRWSTPATGESIATGTNTIATTR